MSKPIQDMRQPMIVNYRRVSSDGQNLDRQDFDHADRTFSEKMSGATRDRPALTELIGFCREGDEVVIHSIDRLARSLQDLQSIIEELNRKGVSVTFISENLTFAPGNDDPTARLYLHLLGAFAQFERALIKKRQREGIAKAKERGVYKGRPKVIDATKVRELKAGGMGASEIARELGVGRASVYRLLTTEPMQAG